MIYSLRGILTKIQNNFIVVECAGVGYKCVSSSFTQAFCSDKEGQEVLIYTYMNVRQDAVDFFGFSDISELECFKFLISVSGVGPKAALAILSEFPPCKIAELVSCGDGKSLSCAPGIGIKTAQRIILELKDKLSCAESILASKQKNNLLPRSTKNKSEALKALISLGYSQHEVSSYLSSLNENLSIEEMIKSTLKNMSKGV